MDKKKWKESRYSDKIVTRKDEKKKSKEKKQVKMGKDIGLETGYGKTEDKDGGKVRENEHRKRRVEGLPSLLMEAS